MKNKNNQKSKKILIILIIIIVITVILIIGAKIYNKNTVEYGIKEYDDNSKYKEYIEKNIYSDNSDIIKLKKVIVGNNSTMFWESERYINTVNNTIYICDFTSGCFNSSGTISTEKISQEVIGKILSLEDEEIPSYEENTNKNIFYECSYWTLEYKDKKINIVNVPEELKNIF